ncbi:Lysine-specific demethylase [Lachnellula suecica]|uniref:Lysine-specific demethylase n=1 Tax=Lachnellula suecica TaxID=602035 RepID=A0A8T9BZT3_9HELO|nr:Lysine-specific demethylase [Lachnellula suecica]
MSNTGQKRGPPGSESTSEELVRICWGLCDPSQLQILVNQSSNSVSKCDQGDRSLLPCGTPILELLLYLCKFARKQGTYFDYRHILCRLGDLITIAEAKCYAFPFKDVPFCWTELLRTASFIKAAVFAMESTWGKTNEMLQHGEQFPALGKGTIDGMVETIDKALIMAGHSLDDDVQLDIDRIFRLLQLAHLAYSPGDSLSPAKRQKHDDHLFPSNFSLPNIRKTISVRYTPTNEAFKEHMHHPKSDEIGPEPLLIKDLLVHWPALTKWQSMSYLKSKTIGGRRLVPVEIGKSYVDAGWGQRIIPFQKFLEDYITDPTPLPGSAVGYLAQYDLFQQIPELSNDIITPDLCFVPCPPPHHSSLFRNKHLEVPQLEMPMRNAWFGPAGTVSPLHTDPYHNILAQVVGRKYIRLYAPREHDKLYPKGTEDGGVDMSNTSNVDIGLMAKLDDRPAAREHALQDFPLFDKADYIEVILEPGDCLYIPLGWWHYVRSLSVSFSVSFWFNDTGAEDNDAEEENHEMGEVNEESAF